MKIRIARKSDIKKIAEIFKEEYRKKPYNEKWTDCSSLKKIKGYFNHHIILVVEDKNFVVGFLIGNIYLGDTGERGYIDEIVVSGKFQGKGYGKALINHLASFLKTKNIRKMKLMSSTKSKAFKFYKKLGFKIEKNFVPMCKRLK